MITMKGFLPPVSKTYYHWEKGLERHGDRYITIESEDFSEETADCWYQTNLLKKKFEHESLEEEIGSRYKHILNSNKPFIVSESNPFREFGGYVRFGWKSYLYDGNFNNQDVNRTRWNKFERDTGITFKDWNSPGDYILIMGQKEGDSSLNKLYNNGYDSMYTWMAEIIQKVRLYSDRPIVIRPHPKNLKRGIKWANRIKNMYELDNISISENFTDLGNQGGEGLDIDINGAYCVITYNSNSAIECATRGIPFYSLDKNSLTHEISQINLENIESLNYDIDITTWQNRIAYTIWNKTEVINGDAWAHLKPVHFK